MGAKQLAFGQDLPGSTNTYLRLKQKGDKVQFRLAQTPAHLAKHFIRQDDGTWDVPECPRIMQGEDCDRCAKYFSIMSRVKKLKIAKSLDDDSAEVKNLRKEAQPYQATIEWYFPILDRADGKFKILQTTNGIRNKFNEKAKNGVDVFAREWLLANTGSESPVNRYMLDPVDSADTKPLSPEEEEEFEKAKHYDLSGIGVNAGRDDADTDEDEKIASFDKFAEEQREAEKHIG